MASILPILLYSIIYFAFLKDISYWDRTAWIVIAVVSALYPVNWIWLYMIFVPAEWALDKVLGSDVTKNKFLEGNFAPIDGEDQYLVSDDRIVSG